MITDNRGVLSSRRALGILMIGSVAGGELFS